MKKISILTAFVLFYGAEAMNDFSALFANSLNILEQHRVEKNKSTVETYSRILRSAGVLNPETLLATDEKTKSTLAALPNGKLEGTETIVNHEVNTLYLTMLAVNEILKLHPGETAGKAVCSLIYDGDIPNSRERILRIGSAPHVPGDACYQDFVSEVYRKVLSGISVSTASMMHIEMNKSELTETFKEKNSWYLFENRQYMPTTRQNKPCVLIPSAKYREYDLMITDSSVAHETKTLLDSMSSGQIRFGEWYCQYLEKNGIAVFTSLDITHTDISQEEVVLFQTQRPDVHITKEVVNGEERHRVSAFDCVKETEDTGVMTIRAGKPVVYGGKKGMESNERKLRFSVKKYKNIYDLMERGGLSVDQKRIILAIYLFGHEAHIHSMNGAWTMGGTTSIDFTKLRQEPDGIVVVKRIE